MPQAGGWVGGLPGLVGAWSGLTGASPAISGRPAATAFHLGYFYWLAASFVPRPPGGPASICSIFVLRFPLFTASSCTRFVRATPASVNCPLPFHASLLSPSPSALLLQRNVTLSQP